MHDPVRVTKRARRWVRGALRNARFAARHRALWRTRKIVYCLTPTHPNVGDHAQAVAIRRWLAKHLPRLPVVEVDDKQVLQLLPALRCLTRDDDLLFLHSGGNLGDRYPRPEQGRRALIQAFPRNRIISLPQTIFFSDTAEGREQQAMSQRIYNAHPALTVMARDATSAALARELFPQARTLGVPDFALSLEPRPAKRRSGQPRALLCLRDDPESALGPGDHQAIAAALPYECALWDTTVSEQLDRENREAVLEQTLASFQSAHVVVTDRLHGAIFAVLCRKPCVALPTVDQKLVAGMQWFRDMPFVALASSVGEVPALVERCLAADDRTVPEWNADYFDPLPQQLGLR